MPEAAHILAELKSTLKLRRITYRQLAASLGLTESGVKKMFSAKDLSLERAIAICDTIGVAFEDLVASAAMHRKPARLTRAQEAFFVENPQCFYYLLELVERGAVRGLDARTERAYVTALASQGCVRKLPSGGVTVREPFRYGVAIDGRIARVILHAQQTALLEAARATPKGSDNSIASLGMATLRLRRDTVVELVRAIHERAQELERRARREAVTTPADQLVEVGLMTVLAPFSWAQRSSSRDPRRAV